MRHRIHRLPAPEEKADAVLRMFDAIAPRYDLVNRVMTFGLDVGWRRVTVESLALEPGSLVLDLACGTGGLCRELHRLGMHPIGFDFSSEMLARARTTAPLVQADVLSLPVNYAAVDGIACGFALRNVVDLQVLFRECARVLRRAGRAAFLEVGRPRAPLLRWGHDLYFRRVVPVIGALLSDRSAYRYLPESVAYLPPTGALLTAIEDAGFSSVTARTLGLGAVQLITGTRR